MYVEEEIVAEAGTKRATLVKHYEGVRRKALARIEQFQKDIAENPAKALEWADQVFEATAKKDVADMVLYMLKHYSEISDISKSLQSTMRDKARYIDNKSTSVCGNYLKECLLGQVVQALEHVELVDSF